MNDQQEKDWHGYAKAKLHVKELEWCLMHEDFSCDDSPYVTLRMILGKELAWYKAHAEYLETGIWSSPFGLPHYYSSHVSYVTNILFDENDDPYFITGDRPNWMIEYWASIKDDIVGSAIFFGTIL